MNYQGFLTSSIALILLSSVAFATPTDDELFAKWLLLKQNYRDPVAVSMTTWATPALGRFYVERHTSLNFWVECTLDAMLLASIVHPDIPLQGKPPMLAVALFWRWIAEKDFRAEANRRNDKLWR